MLKKLEEPELTLSSLDGGLDLALKSGLGVQCRGAASQIRRADSNSDIVPCFQPR
jgi:hypothetical protein